MSTVALQAQCLCRAQTFTTTVATASLPLKGSCCHCTSCRHFSGALRSSDAVWPGDPVLKRYQHSPRVNVLFCGTCGSGMFFEEWDDTEAKERGGVEEASYLVFTGVLSVVEGGALEGRLPVVLEDHVFVGDTLDGGAACWLRGINGTGQPQAKVWLGRRNQSEEVKAGTQWPAVGSLMEHGANLKGEKGDVPLRCHCRGVDLVLRAGDAQREFEEMQKNGEELPRFVDPRTHKLLGELDACDSCRIWGASELFNWTFAWLKHISFAGAPDKGFPANTAQLKAAVEAADDSSRDPRLGTLAVYTSSPHVQRYFCGRCSASVFYTIDDRPDKVDIAVGLLDSPDGARAESVISWSCGRETSWRDDMIGTWRVRMLHAVEKEAEQWRIERGYPTIWYRLAQEQVQQVGGDAP
ncbi:hypothetical protein N657DRAFT_582188 [Parathielavia appendiculata]|uniref:CENP-V/GFA domain-containing protein n=1 Tax=Parathielavia appendiculata TaxID=2587402 RepID=A0AAN6TR90_9PEZI|nr:hypothetical protein N657DRAFT_582188 [Parathielavia appendiculata]